MNGGADWGDDPELNEIVSPLASNARLRTFIGAFETREEELRANDFDDEEASERHFAEVERVADYLGYRDYCGGLDQWDWAAQFLSDEGFRNLYPSDRHWQFEDFIKDDADEFLANQNWENFARTQMTIRERQNLLTVLSYFETAGWGSAMLRLQRLLGECSATIDYGASY